MLTLMTYERPFVRTYARLSLHLEIEHQAAGQYAREAFSNDEIQTSKCIMGRVSAYQSRLDAVWRRKRWMVEVVHLAREKNKSATASSNNSRRSSASGIVPIAHIASGNAINPHLTSLL